MSDPTYPKMLDAIKANVGKVLNDIEGKTPVSGDLSADQSTMARFLEGSADVVQRQYSGPPRALLVYVPGLTHEIELLRAVEQYLLTGQGSSLGVKEKASTFDEAHHAVFLGSGALFLDGVAGAIIIAAAKMPKPQRSQIERVVRGPHTSFSGDHGSDIGLLRAELPTSDLKVERVRIGEVAAGEVTTVYLASKADPGVLEELRNRLATSRPPGLTDTSQLLPAMADDPLSPFPNSLSTERIDRTVQQLLEGRVAILADRSPTALIVPATLADLMMSSEDRYLSRYIVIAARFLRYLGFFLTFTLEALYIALVTLHQELLPTPLALAIARSRSGVPFPPVVEVLVMAVVIDILREAAIRLPSILSETIAIVGTLVIGQAVVAANLISSPVIVISALVALTSFMIPNYELALSVRMLRYPAMIVSGVLGLFGLSVYGLMIALHMARLRSFGMPYLAPMAPLRPAFASTVAKLGKPIGPNLFVARRNRTSP